MNDNEYEKMWGIVEQVSSIIIYFIFAFYSARLDEIWTLSYYFIAS